MIIGRKSKPIYAYISKTVLFAIILIYPWVRPAAVLPLENSGRDTVPGRASAQSPLPTPSIILRSSFDYREIRSTCTFQECEIKKRGYSPQVTETLNTCNCSFIQVQCSSGANKVIKYTSGMVVVSLNLLVKSTARCVGYEDSRYARIYLCPYYILPYTTNITENNIVRQKSDGNLRKSYKNKYFFYIFVIFKITNRFHDYFTKNAIFS